MKLIIENKIQDSDSIFDVCILVIHEKTMFIRFENSNQLKTFVDYIVESADEDVKQHLIADMKVDDNEFVFVGIPLHYINNEIRFQIKDDEML